MKALLKTLTIDGDRAEILWFVYTLIYTLVEFLSRGSSVRTNCSACLSISGALLAFYVLFSFLATRDTGALRQQLIGCIGASILITTSAIQFEDPVAIFMSSLLAMLFACSCWVSTDATDARRFFVLNLISCGLVGLLGAWGFVLARIYARNFFVQRDYLLIGTEGFGVFLGLGIALVLLGGTSRYLLTRSVLFLLSVALFAFAGSYILPAELAQKWHTTSLSHLSETQRTTLQLISPIVSVLFFAVVAFMPGRLIVFRLRSGRPIILRSVFTIIGVFLLWAAVVTVIAYFCDRGDRLPRILASELVLLSLAYIALGACMPFVFLIFRRFRRYFAPSHATEQPTNVA